MSSESEFEETFSTISDEEIPSYVGRRYIRHKQLADDVADDLLLLFNSVLKVKNKSWPIGSYFEDFYGPLNQVNEIDHDSQSSRRKTLAMEYGVFVSDDAMESFDLIERYIMKTRSSLKHILEASFYSQWCEVFSKEPHELLLNAILHYLTNARPDHSGLFEKVDRRIIQKLAVISAIGYEEALQRCEKVLCAPVALRTDMLMAAVHVLEVFNVNFNKLWNKIKNKEARTLIIQKVDFEVLTPTEFIRRLIYDATGSLLLIKNRHLYSKIEESQMDISGPCIEYSLKSLSSEYNRFKPIFLAFKTANREANAAVVNKLAKLSKVHHQPLPSNPILEVAHKRIIDKKEQQRIREAPMPALLRALQACYVATKRSKSCLYPIRNGKVWVKQPLQFESSKESADAAKFNMPLLTLAVRERLALKNVDTSTKVYIPSHIEYGLPTSAKSLAGTIPFGTQVHRKKNEDLVVGIAWRKGYQATDLDLSSQSVTGRVGWNSSYNLSEVTYSGDVVGLNDKGYASECIRFAPLSKGEDIFAVNVNCYCGHPNYFFDILVGTAPNDDPKTIESQQFLLDPNNILCSAMKIEMSKRECTLGFVKRRADSITFYLTPRASGSGWITNDDVVSDMRIAFEHQTETAMTFNYILFEVAGCQRVGSKEEADLDLSVEALHKSTFIELLS